MAESQKAPVKAVSQPAARGEEIPSLDVLHKNGYRNALDWQLKQSPPLLA